MKKVSITVAIAVFMLMVVNAHAEEPKFTNTVPKRIDASVSTNLDARSGDKAAVAGALSALNAEGSKVQNNPTGDISVPFTASQGNNPRMKVIVGETGKIGTSQSAVQGKRGRMKALTTNIPARAGLSIPTKTQKKIKMPKINTTPQIKSFRKTKFRQTNFQSRIASMVGISQRKIQSTNSAMSNMQVRYMNKVMNGKIDYAINQGNRR